ncbi:MAG TPA: DUF72 domain-containing protein [Rudaea sp.]|nr:DUF72 domain-containing protein [Rudaea sp.]
MSQAQARVGIGGWNYAPWRNNFYPAKLPQRRELEFASRQLSAIEINSTYYGAQKPATYAKWRSETPEGFVFSLKAPRYTTEGRHLADGGKTIEGFVFGGIAELGDRLGPVSWQFTPSRRFERDDFARFLDLLPRELDGRPLRHVLEVRNPSFLCDEYLALARQHGLPTVFTDSPDYPSFADVTGDFVYARLMRSQSAQPTGYAPAELDAWAERIRVWLGGGAPADLPYVQAPPAPGRPRDVFVYFISAAKERNPAAAKALIERLAG